MKCSTTRIGTQLSRRDAQAKIHRRRKESKICIIYKVECFYVYSFVSDRVNVFICYRYTGAYSIFWTSTVHDPGVVL